MPTSRRAPALALALLLAAAPAAHAQRAFEQPQDPCKVKAGHHLVNGGMMHLKVAVETGNERTRRERLEQARDVIVRAIQENNQADNPGAWYYLGRYYVEADDPVGADSAFRRLTALMPECETEATGYVARLQPAVRAAALEAWQAGAVDSATSLLHLAGALAPADPEIPFLQARLYADQRQFDSASKYVDIGIERAAGDTAYAQRQRQVMLQVLRGREAVAFESPAIQQFAEARIRRDSVEQAIRYDRARLETLIQEWAGKNLRPETQQAVSRDSTALADRIAAGEARREEVDAAAARDSAAAAVAFQDVFAAYDRYLALYPDDTDVVLALLRRHSLIGDARGVEEVAARVEAMPTVDPGELTQAGVGVFNDGHAAQAARLLELSAERNPYLQSTQYALTRAYYAMRDGPQLQRAVARLLALDPLNPQSVRMLAAAWELAGEQDSVAKYVALADSGLGLAVTVTQFIPAAGAATANGSIQNLSSGSSAPAAIVFEFLDASGSVVGAATVDVPALESRRRHAFTARADGTGAVAWRYRRQP
jgi:tetratricopeptide (TPR) repeat protein